MKQIFSAVFCGLLFGFGLSVARMIDPGKVLDFLDITAVTVGGWDPSLALVMAGALVTHAIGSRLVRRRGAPFLTPAFSLPTRRDIDPRLIVGSSIFGIGWGLGGICPGPALADLSYLDGRFFLFVAAMGAGMLFHDFLFTRPRHAAVADPV